MAARIRGFDVTDVHIGAEVHRIRARWRQSTAG